MARRAWIQAKLRIRDLTPLGIKRAAHLVSVSLALSLLTGGALLYAQEATRTTAVKPVKLPEAKRFTRQIAPGVEFVQEALEEGHPEGPLMVSVVRVNLKREGVKRTAAYFRSRQSGELAD